VGLVCVFDGQLRSRRAERLVVQRSTFTAFLLLSRRARPDAIVSDDLVCLVRQLGAPNHWRVIHGVDSWRPGERKRSSHAGDQSLVITCTP
jgi:hypothetical protein